MPKIKPKKPKAVLALDYGEKSIGLAFWKQGINMAIGKQSLTQKQETYNSSEGLSWWNFIINKLKRIIKRYKIEMIVIGLPKRMDNQDSSLTRQVRNFADYVKLKLNLPIALVDERLSTQEALKKKALDIHQEAARIILENYLNSTNLY